MPTHIFLFAHDEGACWAPQELYDHSIILTHWGRMDAEPHSSSRYIPDNWEATWTLDERAPNGQRWSFPRRGGSRAMIGKHPCYTPGKDLVIPVYAPPAKWRSSPWLHENVMAAALARRTGGGTSVEVKPAKAPRPTLAYFSGNLAEHEPLKYARGIRHRLRAAFAKKPGWRLVGKAGAAYSKDLSQSEFCIVPPGGDGWSSRVDDSVRHGCIPVIVMDNVHMPFETGLNYSEFSVRVPEAQVEEMDAILRSVSRERRAAMRAAMRRLWTRFIYTRSFLDADAYLGGPAPTPAGSDDGRRVLPRAHLQESTFQGLSHAVERGAPDALETIMLELALRLDASRESGGGEATVAVPKHAKYDKHGGSRFRVGTWD